MESESRSCGSRPVLAHAAFEGFALVYRTWRNSKLPVHHMSRSGAFKARRQTVLCISTAGVLAVFMVSQSSVRSPQAAALTLLRHKRLVQTVKTARAFGIFIPKWRISQALIKVAPPTATRRRASAPSDWQRTTIPTRGRGPKGKRRKQKIACDRDGGTGC